MSETSDDVNAEQSLLELIKDALWTPIRIALSPVLLRTYLRTALILFASTLLFAVAVIAYSSFYYAYIPVRGIAVPVYLQFDANARFPYGTPYGVASVKELVGRQKYDVVVDIEMPRSRKNLNAGNWMLGVEMWGPMRGGGDWAQWVDNGQKHPLRGAEAGKEGRTAPTPSEDTANGQDAGDEKPLVLAHSRRPAILTYRSWMTESVYRTLRLPLYVMGWGQESETLTIKMMEDVEFARGWQKIPTSIRLEVRSTMPLEVYNVSVRFEAKLEGLRWFMYHRRLTSAAVFTTLFWATEMAVVLFTWAAFALMLGGSQNPHDIKPEKKRRGDRLEHSDTATPKSEPVSSPPATPLSDVSRIFPTLHSHPALHFSSSEGAAKLKDERTTPRLEDIPAKTEEEADDEDEDADFILEETGPSSSATGIGFTDSGIGTGLDSMSEKDMGWRKGMVRRRSGKGGRRGG